MAEDFAKMLFTKMAWVQQSQDVVLRLANVFRNINVSGTGYLRKKDFYRGLADTYGDMGFSESEWESMFELMEVNLVDGSFDF